MSWVEVLNFQKIWAERMKLPGQGRGLRMSGQQLGDDLGLGAVLNNWEWEFNTMTLESRVNLQIGSSHPFGAEPSRETGFACLVWLLSDIALVKDGDFEAVVRAFDKSGVDYRLVQKALQLGLLQLQSQDFSRNFKDHVLKIVTGDVYTMIREKLEAGKQKVYMSVPPARRATLGRDFVASNPKARGPPDVITGLVASQRNEFVNLLAVAINKPAGSFRELLNNLHGGNFNLMINRLAGHELEKWANESLAEFAAFAKRKPASETEFSGILTIWQEYTRGKDALVCRINLDTFFFESQHYRSFLEFLYGFAAEYTDVEGGVAIIGKDDVPSGDSLSDLPFAKVKRFLLAELMRMNGGDVVRMTEVQVNMSNARLAPVDSVKVKKGAIASLYESILASSDFIELFRALRSVSRRVFCLATFDRTEKFEAKKFKAHEGLGKGWHKHSHDHSVAARKGKC